MSAARSIGMVLDRALNLKLLDVALRVATEHGDTADARQLLTVALRDFVTPQEAENKTRKVLTCVWVVPPSNAQAMICWAIEHQHEVTDRRALHFDALLAFELLALDVAPVAGPYPLLELHAENGSTVAVVRDSGG